MIAGHRYRFKDMMVHSATTLQPQSVQLLFAIATINDFDIWTSDDRQAFLQSAEPHALEIVINNPVPKFQLDPSQCVQLLLLAYGLCKSGDIWHETVEKHHREA